MKTLVFSQRLLNKKQKLRPFKENFRLSYNDFFQDGLMPNGRESIQGEQVIIQERKKFISVFKNIVKKTCFIGFRGNIQSESITVARRKKIYLHILTFILEFILLIQYKWKWITRNYSFWKPCKMLWMEKPVKILYYKYYEFAHIFLSQRVYYYFSIANRKKIKRGYFLRYAECVPRA